MPDLNQLPPSPQLHLRTSELNISEHSTPQRGGRTPPSPSQSHIYGTSPASHSLAAAAALNSSLVNESQDSSGRSTTNGSGSLHGTPSAQRRRSSIRMNLNMNDPSLPSPGELAISPGGLRAHPSQSGTWPASPSGRHQRTPSLGELHQELENEQEAQVNRLLSMIRQQQTQIQHLQSQPGAIPTGPGPNGSAIAVEDGAPLSERTLSFNHSATVPQQNVPAAQSQPPHAAAPRPRSPFYLSRHSSYRSSRSSHEVSPSIRPMSTHGPQSDGAELLLGPAASTTRDESAFYQAETQMLTRENQMLRMRIRELERQLNDTNSTSPIAHSPVMPSNLHHRTPLSGSGNGEAADGSGPTLPPAAVGGPMDTSKG